MKMAYNCPNVSMAAISVVGFLAARKGMFDVCLRIWNLVLRV